MPVKFRNFASGGSLPTVFSDNFNRANTGTGFGPNWLSESGPLQANGPIGNIQASQARFTATTLTAQTPGSIYRPWSLINSAVWGLPQFSQSQLVGAGGANGDYYGAVMISGSILDTTNISYVIRFGAANIELGLLFNTTFVQLGTTAMANQNDVLRLEVVPAAAGNHLAVMRNGAKEIDVVDANANRPVGIGSPGLHIVNMPLNAVFNLDNFRAGANTLFIH